MLTCLHVGGGELPLKADRGSDQQRKEDRHQYRGYQPCTKIEFACIGHMTAFLVEAGAQRSQSPITAGGAR
jgi:hypothetical protein